MILWAAASLCFLVSRHRKQTIHVGRTQCPLCVGVTNSSTHGHIIWASTYIFAFRKSAKLGLFKWHLELICTCGEGGREPGTH